MKNTTVKKGQILQQRGEFNTKIFVVKSGLLRSYSIDKRGKEHIYMFASENWILADNIPPNQPSNLFIDALEDSELTIIEKEKESPDPQKLINRLFALQKRIIMLMSASAIERYESFIETYPDIAQRVPQRMIASYLGITPEALSKVKGDRKRKMDARK
ncbi:MAG: Crp/Fnr family transcriptional regulator [Chitinophagales bacterium]